jgi:hypothetical protein
VLIDAFEHAFDHGILRLVEFTDFASNAAAAEELVFGDEFGLEGVWVGVLWGDIDGRDFGVVRVSARALRQGRCRERCHRRSWGVGGGALRCWDFCAARFFCVLREWDPGIGRHVTQRLSAFRDRPDRDSNEVTIRIWTVFLKALFLAQELVGTIIYYYCLSRLSSWSDSLHFFSLHVNGHYAAQDGPVTLVNYVIHSHGNSKRPIGARLGDC